MVKALQQRADKRDGEDEDTPEPPQLRFLRRLVTMLMVTMIVGISVIAGTLVYGITKERRALPMTEIKVEEGLVVTKIDHSQPDRLIIVVRDQSGKEAVRIYRSEGETVPRYSGPIAK